MCSFPIMGCQARLQHWNGWDYVSVISSEVLLKNKIRSRQYAAPERKEDLTEE